MDCLLSLKKMKRESAVMTESKIRTCSKLTCHVCGNDGVPLYGELRDVLFGVSGVWQMSRCANKQCRLVWLNPAPIAEDLGQAYRTYYTHEDSAAPAGNWWRSFFRRIKAGYLATKFGYWAGEHPFWIRLLGRLFYLHPGQRARLDAGVFHLSAQPGGELLEIGCGTGAALKHMKSLGWTVEGVDFDANCVRNARGKGLEVRLGDVFEQEYGVDSFDAVVMSHVLEHVPDPLKLLEECHRILRPGGQLVVLTPNTNGGGHRWYKAAWRGLEPPRHLNLFNQSSLTVLADRAGFGNCICRTSVRSWKIFLESHRCARGDEYPADGKYSRTLRMWAESLELLSGYLKVLVPGIGEELRLIGRKND